VRATAPTTQHWIKHLGSDSYRDRLEAEDQLRQLGENAREALSAAAKDGRDGEVQWRAKRLLRQLENPEQAPGVTERDGAVGQEPGLTERRSGGRSPATGSDRGEPSVPGVVGIEDMRAEFERLFRHMEQQHGLDVPRHRFSDDTFFKDLKSQLHPERAGKSMSVQVTPEGVRVEVTEPGSDGKPETKVYEAKDMESFHREHPGVLQQDGGGLGLRGSVGRGGFGRADVGELLDEMRSEMGAPQRDFEWQMLKPQVVPFDQVFRPQQRGLVPRGGDMTAPLPATGRRLGVAIRPIPDALRDYLELEQGQGLMVDSVQDDTLAVALQLRAGDIVLSINGASIASADDVQKALGAIEKGAKVTVEFIRRGDRRKAETSKLHDAQEDAQEDARDESVAPEAGKQKRVRESIR